MFMCGSARREMCQRYQKCLTFSDGHSCLRIRWSSPSWLAQTFRLSSLTATGPPVPPLLKKKKQFSALRHELGKRWWPGHERPLTLRVTKPKEAVPPCFDVRVVSIRSLTSSPDSSCLLAPLARDAYWVLMVQETYQAGSGVYVNMYNTTQYFMILSSSVT